MKKVLAIIDDWERLERIEDRLRSTFEVLSAPFGALGVQKALEEIPDFILIDLEFENMTEQEALKLILAHVSLNKSSIVVISNSGKLGDQDTLSRLRVLKRPVSIELLVRALEEFHGTTPIDRG